MDGKSLLDLRTKINKIEAELNLKNKELESINEKLNKSNSELDEYKIKLNSSEEETNKLNQTILDKKNENEIVKSDLDAAINDKKELIQRNAYKNKEIEKLQNDLASKKIECDDLSNEINEFKTSISNYQSLSKIIEDLRDVMKIKGFLSDREFEQVLGK